MRAALRRRRREVHTKLHTHTYAERERYREENNPERARGWSRGEREWGVEKKFGKKG